jgi:stage II sporulation protein D
MRHPLLPIALTAAVTALAAATAHAGPVASPGQPTFVLAGGGWGHGVGMSQWGAYGQALEGRTHEEILAVYYQGTTLEQMTPRSVRVLVAPGARTLLVRSTVPYRIRDSVGASYGLPAGELVLDSALEPDLDGMPTPLVSPVTILPGAGAPLGLGTKTYRGRLTVSSDGAKLQAVNVVGLEQYLQGVVPGEMPKSWPAAALAAQAVAARTYALVSLVKSKPYDLYPDVRSQVYYGAGAESAATTAAVRATRGQVLVFGGKPAQTLYFSSSGGRTRSAVDVYGNDFPYLRAVDDPWDAVPGNPNYRWQPITLTAKRLAAALKLGSPAADVVTTLGGDGRPASVTLTTLQGAQRTVSARDLRSLLGLRSTSFRLGVLRLAQPAAAVAGDPVPLEGVARNVEGPQLERLGPDGAWTRARKLAPRPDGSFRVIVRPTTTTTYRLSGGGVAGPAVTVTVDEAPA